MPLPIHDHPIPIPRNKRILVWAQRCFHLNKTINGWQKKRVIPCVEQLLNFAKITIDYCFSDTICQQQKENHMFRYPWPNVKSPLFFMNAIANIGTRTSLRGLWCSCGAKLSDKRINFTQIDLLITSTWSYNRLFWMECSFIHWACMTWKLQSH